VEEVKAYIESGILELYVLDELNAQERLEVEKMAAKYSEIKTELNAIELAMEAYALENAVQPSKDLSSAILSQLNDNQNIEVKEEVKIIPLNEGFNNSKIKTLKYALVACVALLVISVAALISLYNQLDNAHEQIASLSTNNDQFARTVSKLEFEKAGMENRIAMTETNEWATVKLAGVKNSPDAKMLVYWNKNNKNILINYAAMNLPKTDTSHEYQLWALVDGKPVSLGVFDDTAKEAVIQMQTIEKAQAFAVTIEPMGGSINPTMEQMVVMGNVASI
jgi:anti-sigma-K factor RskA